VRRRENRDQFGSDTRYLQCARAKRYPVTLAASRRRALAHSADAIPLHAISSAALFRGHELLEKRLEEKSWSCGNQS